MLVPGNTLVKVLTLVEAAEIWWLLIIGSVASLRGTLTKALAPSILVEISGQVVVTVERSIDGSGLKISLNILPGERGIVGDTFLHGVSTNHITELLQINKPSF